MAKRPDPLIGSREINKNPKITFWVGAILVFELLSSNFNTMKLISVRSFCRAEGRNRFMGSGATGFETAISEPKNDPKIKIAFLVAEA
jgi:hypothetical protein